MRKTLDEWYSYSPNEGSEYDTDDDELLMGWDAASDGRYHGKSSGRVPSSFSGTPLLMFIC